jgi:predicted hotdog family 3-hydroxylacyl-ACP dehydratase
VPCGDDDLLDDLRWAYHHIEQLTTRLRCLHRPELNHTKSFPLLASLRTRLADQLVAAACRLEEAVDPALLGDPELVTDCVVEVLRATASGGGILRVAAENHTVETAVVLAVEGVSTPAPRLPWALLYAESVARAHGGEAVWDEAGQRLSMHFPKETAR